MRGKTAFAAIILMMASGFLASGQTSKGAITQEILNEIRTGYKGTPSDKAIKNALNTTSMSVLAANSENAAMIDTHFSDMVTTKGRTDQKSSGRCWLFTGLNVLRAKAIQEKNMGEFTFSQNYLFFYDQLEKANLFLQGVIDTKDLGFDDRKVDWRAVYGGFEPGDEVRARAFGNDAGDLLFGEHFGYESPAFHEAA